MRRSGIRLRVTAIAVVATALILLVASVGVVVLQRGALVAGLDRSLTQRADDLEALISESPGPSLPPASDEGFAQLVGNGEVIAATPNLQGHEALPLETPAHRGVAGDFTVSTRVPEIDDDEFRVLSRATSEGTLHVGVTQDPVTESSAALALGLALMIPIAVAAIGGLVWWLVGRTLLPVERIRAEVESIGGDDLDRRVPRPDTGDEIDLLAGTMNDMLARLQSSSERQRRFVGDASHELRTPLTRLRVALEVDAAGRGWSQETRAHHEEVMRMQAMVEDLLFLARMDDDAREFDLGPTDLDEIVIEEVRAARASTAKTIDVAGVSGACVLGKRVELERAFRNLLDNAIRHASSTVTVELREEAGEAVLTVGDDGPGIPPERAGAIFERFGRVDESRASATGGSGLGLAIARGVVDRHGGTLSLVSGAPGLTRFAVRLPLAS